MDGLIFDTLNSCVHEAKDRGAWCPQRICFEDDKADDRPLLFFSNILATVVQQQTSDEVAWAKKSLGLNFRAKDLKTAGATGKGKNIFHVGKWSKCLGVKITSLIRI